MKQRNGVLVLGVMLMGFSLAACGQVNSALDQASEVAGKAGVCTEALGISNFNPANLSPDKVAEEAAQKAERLRELGNKVAEADVQQTLFTMADSYVALEKKQAEGAGNVVDWVRENTQNLDNLRKACF